MSYLLRRSLAVGSLLLASACASVTHNPPPVEHYENATVFGRDDLRFWGAVSSLQVEEFRQAHADEGSLRERMSGIADRPHHYLALSGGGANGAFGAGVLVGWSELGTRPEFTMVTGISTGALIAPFAFLGARYDQSLTEIYTTLEKILLELEGFFLVL